MLDSRRIFQPQVWTAGQAYAFLREVPSLEASGIITRIPDWWKNGRATRPVVSVRIGEKSGGVLGVEKMLQFSIESTLGGESLTPEEWQALMNADTGLVSLRGQWVEVDRDKLRSVLEHWRKVQSGAAGEGVSFLEGIRLLAGVKLGAAAAEEADGAPADWSEVVAGGGLRDMLERLRQPDSAAEFDPNEHLNARLRPYQETGVKWLWFLQSLGLGACLADDMGLGKTIQVIALLLRLKHGPEGRVRAGAPPVLLIAPASLLANWKSELTRFAPTLKAAFAHPSETSGDSWREAATADAFLAGKDVILTTYGQAMRLGWLGEREWRLIVLDEAQAIKNPSARQTAPLSASALRPASRSAARRSRTASAICGRSTIFSIPACSAARRTSLAT